MLQKLVDHVGGHCDRGDVVNIHDVVFMANLNLLLTTIFSITSPDTAMELMKIMEDFFSLFAPNITDYFPILKVLDPQGMKRKAELSLGKLLKKFRDFLNHRLDHRMNNPKNKKQDLLEAIIDTTQGNDYNITTQDIPYLLFELIVGGIDTNSNMVEWIMTELLFNPDKLKRLNTRDKESTGREWSNPGGGHRVPPISAGSDQRNLSLSPAKASYVYPDVRSRSRGEWLYDSKRDADSRQYVVNGKRSEHLD
ncbi:ferruginol synthase-like [Salvia splendens]|uniref:ferruginol synthase-like n=1 Tax=Salvia splendens TaxID=180675 RepID=UPI001C25B4F6|nr:ferruginol synthase-like [Salvia splendens]